MPDSFCEAVVPVVQSLDSRRYVEVDGMQSTLAVDGIDAQDKDTLLSCAQQYQRSGSVAQSTRYVGTDPLYCVTITITGDEVAVLQYVPWFPQPQPM